MTRAMIVDSSEFWATELKSLLELQEVSVDSWQTRGTGWIETLKHSPLEWLFIEDQLPSRSGLKCLENLQESKVFSGRIVFMHSLQGAAVAQLETLALARGASHILRKPFRSAEVRKILKTNAHKE